LRGVGEGSPWKPGNVGKPCGLDGFGRDAGVHLDDFENRGKIHLIVEQQGKVLAWCR
jgi:hypothetical protein